MKVLHVISGIDPRLGGPSSAMVAMVRAQVAVGASVDVVSMFGHAFDDSTAQQLRTADAQVHLIGPHGRFLARHPQIVPTLNKLIAGADVVHIHALWEQIQHQAARICRQRKKPYLFTLHGMLDRWSLSQSALKKKIYLALRLKRDLNHASTIHVTDEMERRSVEPLGITAPFLVEPYILDLSDFESPPPAGVFRARFTAQLGDRPIVLFMSRVHPKKGLDLLIPAFARLKDSTNAMLVVAGPYEENYKSELDQSINENGITDRVLFTGMLRGPERAAALHDATLFVLPSYQENFGVVVIEAMAVGTPAIVSDQVATHWRVAESQAGEVIPTDTDAMTRVLSRWLDNPAMRATASRNAREYVARTFDPAKQARRWIEYYARLQPR